MAQTWTQVLFIVCAAWSAGLLLAEAALSLAGEGRRPLLPVLVLAAVLPLLGTLVMGFSTLHPERMFNVLANAASPISQQVYASAFAAVASLGWIVAVQRDSTQVGTRAWAAACGVAGLLLVVTAARRHMLPSEPLCDTWLWMLFAIGAALLLGVASEKALCAVLHRQERPSRVTAAFPAGVAAAVANAVGMLAYGLWARGLGMESVAGRLQFDPTHPTAAVGTATSLLTNGEAGCLLACAIAGAVIPLACMVAAQMLRERRSLQVACGLTALVVEIACVWGIASAVL